MVMFGVASSSSRLLAYGIFISRVIDHLGIDMSDVEMMNVNSRQHLLEPSFGLVHFDALEQCLNERIDTRFQSLNDKIDSELTSLCDRVLVEIQRQKERTREHIDQIIFVIRTVGGFIPPPPPPVE
ncbi:hypothetical protein Lal_00026500 [Lupinus albus]|nr:hypothetical protein Lal_00026500 [Lupinus albus]